MSAPGPRAGRLPGDPPRVGPRRSRRVVALGGGHGLSASLQALRHLTGQITAVVTVADDGGSSGRLRQEFDVLPPGDLRMALAALSEETLWGQRWGSVLQHRMGRVPAPANGNVGTPLDPGGLRGHALGNLLLVALWEIHQDPVRGLEEAARLLEIRGRVLPMSTSPLQIEADIDLHDSSVGAPPELIRGQSAVAIAPGRVRQVRLVPHDPPACREAVQDVLLADWVVLGPGSWYTSVLPHLLVPGLREALATTEARRILTLNVSEDTETAGLDAVGHVRVLRDLAPEITWDVVLADPEVVGGQRAELEAEVGRAGGRLVVSAVGSPGRPGVHDSLRLAAAYRDVVASDERG